MSVPKNLFIPPEGAMQFECTHPDFLGKFSGPIWVGQPEDRGGFPNPCNCAKVYPVLEISNASPEHTARVKKSGRALNELAACLCMGRIIE